MKNHKPFNLKTVPQAVRDAEGGSLQVFTNAAKDDEPAELLIMDQIGEDWYGDGVSGESVVAFIKENKGKPINVRINSPGGLCYDGLVIYNSLANHDGQVTVTIEGLAYSAASFIAMAGDVVRMHKASDFGIHRASIIAVGNQKEFRSVVEWLNTIDEHVIDIYQDRTGQDREQIVSWIDGISDGTLFSAAQCKEYGFCDEIIEPAKGKKVSDVAKNAITNCQKRIAARNRLRLMKSIG